MKRKKAISFGLISTDLDKLMDRANKVVRKKKRLRVDQCYKAVIKNNDGEVIWQKRI